jgi:putative phosphoribosyl transferase
MFVNREEAGMRLAVKLLREKNLKNAVIICIPRGGVIVGKTVSEVLKIPFKILIVKKIGTPNNPELAIGATGSDSVVFWDENLISIFNISKKERTKLLKQTKDAIRKREEALGIDVPDVRGKGVIVVDDGVATGATAIAASLILNKLGSSKIILATPVISKRTKHELGKYFGKIISVETPEDFHAVGQFYREFPQVEDEEVRELLRNS